MPPKATQILLLGAGELGLALLPHLYNLPSTHLTLGIRTLSKYTHLTQSPRNYANLTLLSIDLSSPSQKLSNIFARFDVVISCTGFGQDISTFTKLAGEILEAGRLRKSAGKEGREGRDDRLWFFPWQFGVNYDITGDGRGLMPLFGIQRDVRNLLREHAEDAGVKWTVVSTGIFMSFLFEDFWGIVQRPGQRQGEDKGGKGGKITVRALRDWGHKVTVTDVHDIGKVVARIVAGDVDDEADNGIVYVAGDTVSYGELADTISRVTGKQVEREEWTIEHLEQDLAKDPDNGIKKYRLVFARDGVWWDKERTVNYRLGIPVMSVEANVKQHF